VGWARTLGVLAAAIAAVFFGALVALLVPDDATRVTGAVIAGIYVFAGFVIARASRGWATGTAVVVAVLSALLTLATSNAPGSVALDVLILATVTALAIGAAWGLIRSTDAPPSQRGDHE
jgi:hypothetical protein